MDIDTLKVDSDDVIIVRGPKLDYEVIQAFSAELNERFPDTFAVFLEGETEISTMPLDTLEALLKDVVEHRKGVDGRRS